MFWKNLQSFCISLVVLISVFSLTACDRGIDINFPDYSGYNSSHGYFGKITDNNTQEPISDAKITFNNQLYESNDEGYYDINTRSDDFEITIKVSKDGYKDYVQTVRIKGEGTKELNISLIPVE